MKKFLLLSRLLALPFLAMVIFTGCKKETSADELTPQQEEEVALFSMQSETEMQLVFNDVFDNVMGVSNDVGIAGTGVFGRRIMDNGMSMEKTDSINCFTVTKTHLNPPDFFPVKIVLDFGNGCLGQDGHTRYGKIITVYTGRLIHPGKSATTTFDAFKIDSISVQGTHIITNTTALGSNQRQFTVHVDDAKLTKHNGNYSMWDSHRVITQVEGNGTPDLPVDDLFIITGGAHGKVQRFNNLFLWESLITEPLRKKFVCPWISKGTLKVWRQTLNSNSPWVAILDFGNGTCDYLATLTINGVTHNIQLPH